MHNIAKLDIYFKKFLQDIKTWSPESIIEVNLSSLHDLGLLNYHNRLTYDPTLTRFFEVVETSEKITLVNDEFVVWIIPDRPGTNSLTYSLIAINSTNDEPRLEVAFINPGVYNTSRLVLRVLEKILHDIEENEDFLRKIS